MPTTGYANQNPQLPAAPGEQPGAYDFITEPSSPVESGFSLSNSSKALRVAVVTGGLIILFIIFNIVKGVVTRGPDLSAFITIAQDQQAIIHIVSTTSRQTLTPQQKLSTANQNFASTAELSIGTAEGEILKYLANNNTKYKPAVLTLKTKASVDKQLVASVEASTYDQTFKEVSKDALTAYSNDLKQLYPKTKGKIGRGLLQNDYNQAQLLLLQLDAPATQ